MKPPLAATTTFVLALIAPSTIADGLVTVQECPVWTGHALPLSYDLRPYDLPIPDSLDELSFNGSSDGLSLSGAGIDWSGANMSSLPTPILARFISEAPEQSIWVFEIWGRFCP